MGSAKHILLVEDNEINRDLVMESLEGMPFEVDVAVTGVEGVSKFEDGRYDLVIMDLQLPLMDGLEAAGRIRAIEARTGAPRTPIIAATAHAYPRDRKRCIEAGMDDYLSKPFDLEVFVRRVVFWTDRPAA
jgi:CheY-like chemotaxis protein